MSRVRSDYEKTLWRKIVRFVNGEKDLFDEQSGFNVETEELEDRRHRNFFEEAELNKKKVQIAELIEERSEETERRAVKLYERFYRLFAVITCVAVIAILLVTVANLPDYGEPENPANNEVSKKYIEDGIKDTGAVNIVAGMILDYRAFDTLGESHVLFIAAVCVMILLKIDPDSEKGKRFISLENDRAYEPKNDPILVWATGILVPVIIVFGIYVILNGHLSPGGGFSGGAIIGAGLILYLNAFGFKKTESFFTQKTFSVVSVSALLFYSISKTYAFFTGANGIHSIISKGTAGDIISAGLILPLNICVGAVVACTMYSFYGMFRKGGL
jgi:multicomponent Na+:H+ antiporter subunit B